MTPHSDNTATAGDGSPHSEPKQTLWPAFVIIAALIVNLAWVGFLGGLVVRLAAELLP